MKGFVSLLFLALLGETILLIATLDTLSFPGENGEAEHLALRRIELENGVDRLIEQELQGGLILKRSSAEIKTRINQRILAFVDEWKDTQAASVKYEIGTGTLTQTNYLSLLNHPFLPVSSTILDAHSHVLVLPVNEHVWYGEYTYTGGTSGTGIFTIAMSTPESQTLFALPSDHRTCATSLAIVPCVLAQASGE